MSQPWRPQVITGEAVALDLRPAALPSRLLAGLLDAVLLVALLLGLLAVVGAVSASVSEAASAALSVVVVVVVVIGDPLVFETLLRGRTPGKAALGLRVVRDDGGPVGFRHAFVRALAGAFLERPGITFFLGAIVSMLLQRSSKRIGDLLAGTVVLQERVSAAGGTVPVMPPRLSGWAAALDLSGLPDDLALSARQFLSRSAQLTATAREDLGGRLVAAVSAAVRPEPPPGTPGWAVLAAVLAERRRREEQRLGAAAAAWTAGTASGWGAAPAAAATPATQSWPARQPGTEGSTPGTPTAPAPATPTVPAMPSRLAEPPPAAPGGFVVPS